ncbi:hypothetical protein KKC32_01210 [Patescibacteria group bacterium]|nr:hypothetical protein [Patescibacteria group bacterium]
MRKEKFEFSFRIPILITLVIVFTSFLVCASFIYTNLKKVEQNVLNLHEQVRFTNDRIENFGLADDSTAERSVKFSEATKNWQMYQNEEFGFQLKSPASWGALQYHTDSNGQLEKISGRKVSAQFQSLEKQKPIVISFATYDFADKLSYANKEIRQTVKDNKIGECPFELFEQLKDLNIGDIRNCFIKENIFKQKYIMYRHVFALDEYNLVDELLVVHPRENFYLYVNVPDELTSDILYFIDSIVFLQEKM